MGEEFLTVDNEALKLESKRKLLPEERAVLADIAGVLERMLRVPPPDDIEACVAARESRRRFAVMLGRCLRQAHVAWETREDFERQGGVPWAPGRQLDVKTRDGRPVPKGQEVLVAVVLAAGKSNGVPQLMLQLSDDLLAIAETMSGALPPGPNHAPPALAALALTYGLKQLRDAPEELLGLLGV